MIFQQLKSKLAHRAHRRNGTFLTELLVAMSLLSALAATTLPMTMKISRARRLHQEQLIAVEELANQLDRLSRLPVRKLEMIDPQSLLTDYVSAQLSEAEFQVVLEPISTSAGLGRRLGLTLRWQNGMGNPAQIALATWVYPVHLHEDH